MKKILFICIGLTVCVLLFCTWYLHASIYWKLGSTHLNQPSDFGDYTVGEPSGPPITYAAIGDSLTAGVGVDSYTKSYPYLLAEKISSRGHIALLKSFAVPGVRSAYVLSNFIDPVIVSNPDIITLLIGVNDIHGKVSQKVFRENYENILKQLTQKTNARIYAIALPYIGTKDLISLPYRYYFIWRTEQANAIIKELAAQYKVTYIDLYSAHKPLELNDAYYASDFFHQNALGYSLWADFIYANID